MTVSPSTSTPAGVEPLHDIAGGPAMTITSSSTADQLDLDKLRATAAKGQEAAVELAAVELARQQQRTAELERQQVDYDLDILTRAREVDADLDRQRDDALAALQSAVDGADLGAALMAWRQEASCRYAQREWRRAWRDAHGRTGQGPTPPVESTRDAERDEDAAFMVAVTRAAESGARLDADALAVALVGERPFAMAGELVPGPEVDIVHAPNCPGPERTETTRPPVGRGSRGVVVRCMSCAASVLVHAPPPEREDAVAAAPGPELLRRPLAGEQPARVAADRATRDRLAADAWVG